jgi:hypothetical protein
VCFQALKSISSVIHFAKTAISTVTNSWETRNTVALVCYEPMSLVACTYCSFGCKLSVCKKQSSKGVVFCEVPQHLLVGNAQHDRADARIARNYETRQKLWGNARIIGVRTLSTAAV